MASAAFPSPTLNALLRLAATTFLLTGSSAWLLQASGVPILWPVVGLLIAWRATHRNINALHVIVVCWTVGALSLTIFGWRATSSMMIMALSVGEAFFALSLLDRLRPSRSGWPETVDGFFSFVCATVAVSALFAIPAPFAASRHLWENYFSLWVGWTVTVSVGTLAVAPLAWLVYSGSFKRNWRGFSPQKEIITVLAVMAVGLVTLGTFLQSVWPLLFIPIFPLILAAFKLDRISVLLAILVFTLIALVSTEMGFGPIAAAFQSWPAKYLFLQTYLATTFLIVLPVSLELREREQITEDLRAALDRLSASERQAHDLAYIDPLTGLANRRSFLDELDKACHAPKNLTVAMVDLNHFKMINDRWGHLVGDEMLRAVSERFVKAIGPDALIARLGGDEFAVLCTSSEKPDPVELGDRVIKALCEPIQIGRKAFPVRCACGLVWSPAGEARTSSSLLGKADVAMYSAKSSPDQPVAVFCSEMRQDEERKFQITKQLLKPDGRSAIFLDYQPIFDLQSGEIVTFEALARWRHPQLGSISPSEFIPLAERSRVIEPLTWSLLELAIQHAVEWEPDIGLSFNFSAPHLGSDEVVAGILNRLARWKMQPHRLKLEITETALLTNIEETARNCERLQESGVKIVLDDFGSGFASLSYLRTLRFDEIKMDSALTLGSRSKEGYLLTKGVLDLCRAIDVPCTAEHLEAASDVERLRGLGCKYGQGYWLHRPVSAQDAGALAINHTSLLELPVKIAVTQF